MTAFALEGEDNDGRGGHDWDEASYEGFAFVGAWCLAASSSVIIPTGMATIWRPFFLRSR